MMVIHQQVIITKNLAGKYIDREKKGPSVSSKALLAYKITGFSKHELPYQRAMTGMITPAKRKLLLGALHGVFFCLVIL